MVYILQKLIIQKGEILKRTISILLFMFMFASLADAQVYRPWWNVLVKGSVGFPTSDSAFTDGSSTFPGAQLELAYNFHRNWGVYGNFSADFIPSKTSSATLPGATIEYKTSKQFSGYIGPRYYFPMDSKNLMVYADLGVGIYSFSQGDAVATNTANGTTQTAAYSSISQMGINGGAGLNVTVSPSMFLNFGAKYHSIFSKSGISVTRTTTYSNGAPTQTDTFTGDATSRGYFQLTAGVGFVFGR